MGLGYPSKDFLEPVLECQEKWHSIYPRCLLYVSDYWWCQESFSDFWLAVVLFLQAWGVCGMHVDG